MSANTPHQAPPHGRAGLVRQISILLLVLGLMLVAAAVASAQEGDITRGSQIYDANCAVCHGAEGQGRVGVNLSQDFPAIDPNAFLRSVVANGVTGSTMPAWSEAKGGPLSEQDIDDVVAFVESLSGGRSPMAPTATPLPVTPVPTVPGATGDPSLGKVLFIQNCAMCHGEKGQGQVGNNLNKAFSSINPQQFVRATVARGIQGTAMPAWSQQNGGPLTEAEIDNISAYIITLAPSGETPPPTTSTPEPEGQSSGAGTFLLIVLALVLVAVAVILIMQFSSRQSS